MRLKTLTTLVAGAMLAVSAGAQAAIGPSTTTAPYQVGLNGWGITSILTVGDSVNLKPNGVDPYRLVGLVDGLGAFDNGDGTFTVLVNHEIRPDRGIAREHNITGGKGAFVSEWVIRKSDLRVLHGGDLIKSVYLWDDANKKIHPLPGHQLQPLLLGRPTPNQRLLQQQDGQGLQRADLHERRRGR